jgi:hypothetical protein
MKVWKGGGGRSRGSEDPMYKGPTEQRYPAFSTKEIDSNTNHFTTLPRGVLTLKYPYLQLF